MFFYNYTASIDFFFLDFGSKVISYLFLIIPILLIIAFYTLAERKLMAAIQRRKGPNVVGFWGLLQPIADGLKLVLKEIIIPRRSNLYLFFFAPIFSFSLSFSFWAILPFSFFAYLIDNNYSLLFVLALSSLGVFGLIIAGWASNSKYAVLGALRSAAQMISYEICLGFLFLIIALISESLNIFDIMIRQTFQMNILSLFPLFFIFFIVILAETNRAPFDLPEAEAEIVAGYNIEYSAILFALFFLAEYSNMFIMSILFTFCFFGGIPINFWFVLVILFIILIFATLFILIRAILPRVRYDQLMYVGWEIFIPFLLGFVFFLSAALFSIDMGLYWSNGNFFLLPMYFC